MADFIDLLIPNVSAQSSDAIAQPTFGPIDVSGGSSITASVLLNSTKTSVANGERFKVKVQLKTNEVEISEYRIVIDFDPSKLSVVDSDSQSAGTQVKVLDTLFQPEDPEEDNNVAAIGRIRVKASSVDGDTYTVNRDVIEIEFQAQSLGSTTLKIVEDLNGTQLVRQAGVGLAYNPNEITIQISNETDQTTGGGTNGGNNTGTSGTGTIPNTSLNDDLGPIFTLGMGAFLISMGTILFLNSKKRRKNE